MTQLNPLNSSEETNTKPLPSTLFCIISFNELEAYFRIKESCEKAFSKVYLESNPMPKWTIEITEKSNAQIGEGTKILAFQRRINRDELPELKKKCIEIRKKLIKKDPTIRIIPGYLSSHNVILSSVNDDFHRIYLFHGIYAEVIYKYEKLQLQAIDSAPEFFTMNEVVYFFNALRDYHINNEKRY
ncbi:MAG: DUF4416 family protein [Spirochaetia bacterium]|nr:DUF4416 family protein [Spirochaetia bacterium]